MYPYQLDKETIIATGIVLVAYISSYIYRKLRAAAHEVVEVQRKAKNNGVAHHED
jgi:hypothetical protein